MKKNHGNKGKHFSPKTEFKKGEHLREKSPVWKGDEAGNRAIHCWIEYHLGKPDTCWNCGKSGLKGIFIHWSNKDHKYRRAFEDWQRLCASCHLKYDYAQGLR